MKPQLKSLTGNDSRCLECEYGQHDEMSLSQKLACLIQGVQSSALDSPFGAFHSQPLFEFELREDARKRKIN
jgi:hypothetical protein